MKCPNVKVVTSPFLQETPSFQLINAHRINNIISIHQTTIQATMIGKICPFCEEVFDQNMIADHIGIEHFGSQNNVIACKECDKKFRSQSDLKIHRNIVHPSFKFACENCEVRCLSESSLNLHTKIVHSNQTILIKQELSDQSTIRYNLKSNANVIHHRRKLKCDQCSKSFSTKGNMKTHIQMFHEAIQNYQFFCTHCSKSFRYKGSMKMHIEAIHKT